MRQATRIAAVTLLLLSTALPVGCRSGETRTAEPTVDPTISDPCAERLHDLCGLLLLYYAAQGELPANLAALNAVGADPQQPMVCPASGKPYVYNRAGLPMPGWSGRLIVYDAEPSHSGRRWGILAEPARPGHPIVIRVVRPLESVFRATDGHEPAPAHP